MAEEKDITNDIIPIGKEVTIFRTLLNCTQQQFADLLLLSRISISKLEQSKDIEELTPDIAFRLYYATQKILENPNREDYVKTHAKILQGRIDTILSKKIQVATKKHSS